MANTLTTKEALVRRILLNFEANLAFTMHSNRDYEMDAVRWVSDTKAEVEIRMPNNYIVNDTWDITAANRDIKEEFITLTIDQIRNVPYDLSTFEDTYEIDQNKENRTVIPAANNLALKVDNYVARQQFLKTYFHTGTAGTQISTWNSISQMTGIMNELAFPDGGQRVGILSEDSYGSLGSFTDLQNSNATDITKDITRRWKIGNLANIDLFHNHAVVKHIAGVGDANATPSSGTVTAGTVKTAVSSGNTIVVEALKASETGVFLQGDKITIGGRLALHPKTLETTSRPFQVTVLDISVDSSVGGETTITVDPAIQITGPYQNVDAEIPIGATLTLATGNSGAGSTTKAPYTANMFWHPTGLIFAAPKLKSLFKEDTFSTKDNISMRMSSHGDILKSIRTARLDTFFGVKIEPQRNICLLG